MTRHEYEYAKLCYVKDSFAWFTTAAQLQHVRGDDWNDAPYEHNAGDPYAWHERMKVPPYELVKVAFESPYTTPAGLANLNSRYSVQMINAGAIAWLSSWHYETQYPPIMAGTRLAEFRRMIKAAGGEVYEAVKSQEAGNE